MSSHPKPTAGRGRTATVMAAAVLVVGGIVGLAVVRRDDHSPTGVLSTAAPSPSAPAMAPGWNQVAKSDAGLDPRVRLWTFASDGDRAVLAGGIPEEDWQPRAWWSDDGVTWQRSALPADRATPFSVAVHGDVALMTGSLGPEFQPYFPFLWRSEDGGRSWAELEPPDGISLTEVRWLDGRWVGIGLGETGWPSVWTSEDVERWDQLRVGGDGCARADQDLDQCAPTALHDLPGDRVGGFAFENQLWISDGTHWGDPVVARLEESLWSLTSVADGARMGVIGNSWTGAPSQLVRSDDEGRSWAVDESFPGVPLGAYRFGDLQLATGFDERRRSIAWIDTADGWEPVPEELRGPATTGPVGEVDGRIVLFGDSDRFLVYEP